METSLTWLGLQDPLTGWIPREIPLGAEAESKVPSQFLGQIPNVANPPTLLFGVRELLLQIDAIALTKGKGLTKQQQSKYLQKVVPHLAKWFEFLHVTHVSPRLPKHLQMPSSLSDMLDILWHGPVIRNQVVDRMTLRIDEDTCYHWIDRDYQHTMSSGLDDYPRGLFVNEDDECHLDLHVWMTFFADTMVKLCNIVKNDSGSSAGMEFCTALDYKTIKENLLLSLKKNYYDEDAGLFADFISDQPFGTGSKEKEMLVEPPWDGSGQCDPTGQNPKRQCPTGSCCSSGGWCGDSPDHCNCQGCVRFTEDFDEMPVYTQNVKTVYSPHFGYVSCFPWMFGLLKLIGGVSSDSALSFQSAPLIPLNEYNENNKLTKTWLAKFKSELVSKFGIRSLSSKDSLFGKGENYWRGKIWANLNYLTIGQMMKVGSSGQKASESADTKSLKQEVESLGKKLAVGFLNNVMKVFDSKGNFFENYDPKTGAGTGAVPFTGWTAVAFLLLASENFIDVDVVGDGSMGGVGDGDIPGGSGEL